ncbi:MAG: hypothetical protein LRY73_14840 [Bacillus sp. (in: Bacteria)]|nr:hypothetical protein [Bacillus sp. (in: firmicutes)]
MTPFQTEELHVMTSWDQVWADFYTSTMNALEKEYHFPLPSRKIGNQMQNTNENDWLAAWLVRPHFPKYKVFYESLPQQAQVSFAEKAIGNLREQTHHPHVRRVYFQLLLYHEFFDEGLLELLERVADPLQITPEEDAFIASLVDKKKTGCCSVAPSIYGTFNRKKRQSHIT